MGLRVAWVFPQVSQHLEGRERANVFVDQYFGQQIHKNKENTPKTAVSRVNNQ